MPQTRTESGPALPATRDVSGRRVQSEPAYTRVEDHSAGPRITAIPASTGPVIDTSSIKR
jgi:hypothetical protein